jgi:hypothetical protein
MGPRTGQVVEGVDWKPFDLKALTPLLPGATILPVGPGDTPVGDGISGRSS